ncbi:hypothetical protein NE237_008070 [Protea cynaroides]|uniref:Uncharacterized protein n=1 Tax=Protea cynaroides TaxID=273540 RepID=A0A9Q0KR81_9MAGN|nr:hypothetical protein NE237_008070 [Protea cynaroides]
MAALFIKGQLNSQSELGRSLFRLGFLFSWCNLRDNHLFGSILMRSQASIVLRIYRLPITISPARFSPPWPLTMLPASMATGDFAAALSDRAVVEPEEPHHHHSCWYFW